MIKHFLTSVIGTNTYLYYNEGRGFYVDPGDKGEMLFDEAEKLGVKVEAVLLTHGHFDHINAAKYFQDKGVKVYCHSLDAEKLHSYKSMASFAGVSLNQINADVLVEDGDILNIAGVEIKVMWTPGHSEGGVCYIVDKENVIFSGDTLMCASFGRCDFYDGDGEQMRESLKKLFNLDGNYLVYPGHGQETALNFERKNNPINFR